MAIPDECINELTDIQATVLVGSGAEIELDLPDWSGLLAHVATKLPEAVASTVRYFVGKNQHLQAAETARMAYENNAEWEDHFRVFDVGASTTSIWRLVAALGLSRIITTNWTMAPANAFAEIWSRPPQEFVGVDEILLPLSRRSPHVCFPHGKWPRHNTIVFTQTQYNAAEGSDKYKEFWVDTIMRRPLLVVGYSGKDPAFQRLVGYVTHTLGMGDAFKPWVVHGRSSPIAQWGPRARSLAYDDQEGHAPIGDVLRELRDALNARRRIQNTKSNPFQRNDIKDLSLETRQELLVALANVDFRAHCGVESFIGVVVLVAEAAATGTSLRRIADRIATLMRITMVEADGVARNAVGVAQSLGWIRADAENVFSTEAVPRPDSAALEALVDDVSSRAQSPLKWTRNAPTDRYTRDALLGVVGFDSSHAAAAVLGIGSFDLLGSVELQISLEKGGYGIGNSRVEQQICRAAIAVIANPPERHKDLCARLARFAFYTHAAAHAQGRQLLKSAESLERVYLDSNVLLPALAPGHQWHRRCAAFLDKCRRTFKEVFVLDVILEEVESQMSEALTASRAGSDQRSFLRASVASVSNNGFMDAYGIWAEGRTPLPSFSDYLIECDLADIKKRINALGIRTKTSGAIPVVDRDEYRRIQGIISKGGSRPEILTRHEAQQLVRLVADARDERIRSIFVTAHRGLLDIVTQQLRSLAARVVPPIALAHLVDAMRPAEIPLASLRELAFDGPGLEVGEAVFAIICSEWRNNADKVAQLRSDELADLLRSKIDALKTRFSDMRGIDYRIKLADVVLNEVLPAVEATIQMKAASRAHTPLPARSALVSAQVSIDGDPVTEARQLARDILTRDLKL